MSAFPLWAERLFLFMDEWLYLALVLFLFMKWERYSYQLQADKDYHARFNVPPSKHVIERERVWFHAFRVVLIVGAIFVYAVGYLSFFHRCFTER